MIEQRHTGPIYTNFAVMGITWGGVLGQLGTAIIGAVAILWVASLIKK